MNAIKVERNFVRRAVELADLNAVRMALYQITSDPELASLPVAASMDDRQKALVLDKAEAWLMKNAGPRELPEPPEAELRALMKMAMGTEMGDLEFEARRELPAFKPFPYTVSWPGKKPAIPEGFKVVVIGSGFAGVTMGVQLDLLGIPYVILERRAEAGGVWSINRYPDVRVDTSSITYEFSFAKEYTWTEYFGRGPEVRKYINDISQKFGVLPKTRFNHDLKRAVFDEDRDLWMLDVETPNGLIKMEANVVVSCSGLFATPNIVKFKGQESFKGRVLHPARWPDDVDLKGKRVATIGNGSTGVQLLGAVAREAEQVYCFQRTPQWISPRDKYGLPVEPEIAWLQKNFPGYWNWSRFTATVPLFDTHDLMLIDEDWQAKGGKVNPKNDAVREMLTEYIKKETGGRQDLIDRVTPDYAPMSRRPVVDNGWYRALTRDNVELVTDGIEEFTPEGIKTKDGKVRKVDIVISATGFDIVKYLWPAQFIGRNGIDLHESWETSVGPRAYIGMMMPDFPNFYTLYGPNSQPISGGPAQPVWFAVWAGYAAQGIMRLIEKGKSRIEVKREAFEKYNEALNAEARKLVQMTEAGGVQYNYYVNNEHGRLQVNAPWYAPSYQRMCTKVVWEDLEVSGSADRAKQKGMRVGAA